MQILYMFPPALFLWVSYGQSAGTYVVVIPVIVMAAGQLAGGLSWLAISGEDAHDLVVTAPIHPRAVLIAKIEAVLVSVTVVFAPVLLLVAIASVELALITGAFVAISAGSATAIQLWFRVPMRRAMFRRRQVASRVSTISEALSSIMWAGAAVLVAGNSAEPAMDDIVIDHQSEVVLVGGRALFNAASEFPVFAPLRILAAVESGANPDPRVGSRAVTLVSQPFQMRLPVMPQTERDAVPSWVAGDLTVAEESGRLLVRTAANAWAEVVYLEDI